MSSSGEWPVFSNEQKELLRQSWAVLNQNLEGLGILIYEMIFGQCPEAKLLFPCMKHFTKEKNQSKEFAFQALRFVQIFETAIGHLNNLSGIDNILDNLGRRHGRLESSIGFKPDYWVVFRECAIYNIRKVLSTNSKKPMTAKEIDETIIQWRRLISRLIEKIEHGYKIDLANRMSNIDFRS